MLDCLNELLRRFSLRAADEAIVYRGVGYRFSDLLTVYERMVEQIDEVAEGEVVGLVADFSPSAIMLLLALLDRAAIVTLVSPDAVLSCEDLLRIGEVERVVQCDAANRLQTRLTDRSANHTHYQTLRQRKHPGLVFFSSGSSGTPKGAVHDALPLLLRNLDAKKRQRTIAFLLFDHIGGINTLLYALFSGGTVVTVADRRPETILHAIETYRVEHLPTTPSFLNLLLLSEAHTRYDLSSLNTVSYGTEPMPESTLRRFCQLFPAVRMVQKYGLSEIGILPTRSEQNDSLWMQLGGHGCDVRVVDGLLEIWSESLMLGYLNAPSPFTDDGWLMTGDRCEVRGEYTRVLGRDSELINVGGRKVYPAEVESVIQELEVVAEVSVAGEPHPIMGTIVTARIVPRHTPTDERALKAIVRAHCQNRLERYKQPMRILVTETSAIGARLKKKRGG